MSSHHHTHRRPAARLLGVLAVVMTLAGMVACGRSGTGTVRTVLMQRIDDSLHVLAPGARPLIDSAMRTAHDSLEYYEYSACLSRWYSISDTPDSVFACVGRIADYARRVPQSSRVDAMLATAYVSKANTLHNFHRSPDEVLRLGHAAYDLLSRCDDKTPMPSVCANLADAYCSIDDLPSAARWYRRALFLVDSLRLPDEENVTLYMGLGQIYLSLRDFDSSLRYYRQTERFYSTMTPSMQAYFLNNYGNTYYYMRDYRRSLALFTRMRDMLMANGMQNRFDMYLCKVNMADVCLHLGDTRRADSLLDEVQPFFEASADYVAMHYCHTIRIGVAVRQKRAADVPRILAAERGETWRKIREAYVPANLRDIRDEYLRGYYVLTGDYRRAYDNYHASVVRTDSLEHNRQNMRSADIMARFAQDTLTLHHQLEMQRKDADLQRSGMTAMVAVAVAVILLLLLIVYALYLRKRKTQEQMRLMQLKLSVVRNRISPHFVFNVLNNKISSADTAEAAELHDLARLIRTNLDMSCQAATTLADELAFVERYVRVERFMLGSDFDFRLDTPEGFDLAQVRVPSMFVQLLVENALKHGLRGWEGHKSLTVAVTRDGTDTLVTVTDNGPGLRPGALRQKTGLAIITQTLAVINVRNRRKMRFDLANVTAPDGRVAGCRAALRIPDHTVIPE